MLGLGLGFNTFGLGAESLTLGSLALMSKAQASWCVMAFVCDFLQRLSINSLLKMAIL